MTGFGAAEGAVAGGWIRIEIRTVNHRHFNLATKLPAELAVLEGELRERLRREFDRGHVAVQARWTEYPAVSGGFNVDLERARLVTERLRELQSALLAQAVAGGTLVLIMMAFVAFMFEHRLAQQNLLRSLARRVLPPRLSATVAWWIVGLNTGSKPVLDARSRDFLAERLAGDAAHLGRILGRPLPWPT